MVDRLINGSAMNELSSRVIGACIEVHRHLGPGLMESTYQACLCRELRLLGISFQQQVPVPLEYKGELVDCAYRLDVVVEGALILEIKAVEALLPIHDAQLLTYLKLTGLSLGLLINFNVPRLATGVKRLVNQFPSTSAPSATLR
jgi:GxxExxY protein